MTVTSFASSDPATFNPLPLDLIAAAPKVLLHDHLDGGLRPQTVLDLAAESGYMDLPATDASHWVVGSLTLLIQVRSNGT